MDRRDVLRGLVAAGGLSALSACLELENTEIPAGDPARRPTRQHAWNDSLPRDDHGNVRPPNHHVFLSLTYTGTDRAADREHLETALTDLERAYRASNDGLLFTLGYGPAYFDRFDEREDGTIGGVALPDPGPLHADESVGADEADAFLHLASDHASVVLAAREALFGRASANGVEVTRVDDIFEQESRRTGFVGPGLPAARADDLVGLPDDAVSDVAPNFMDFRSGFRETQASEERVTIESGPFAGGTVQHVEVLRFYLSAWYERSTDEQVARLFGPDVDPEAVGPHGEKLTTDNRVSPVDADALQDVAERHGVVGHAQKMARFREDGRPPILRRDVNSDDFNEAGMVFVSLQRAIADFERLRVAMDGRDVAAETPIEEREDNGILQYIRPRRRGNFLIPPRDRRALPRVETPRPE